METSNHTVNSRVSVHREDMHGLDSLKGMELSGLTKRVYGIECIETGHFPSHDC